MKKQYTKKQIQEAISYWKKQLAEGNYRKVNENMNATDWSIMQAYWNKCQEICQKLGLEAISESEMWDRGYICYYIRDPKAPAGERGGNFYFDDDDGTWKALIQAKKVAEGEYSVQDVMAEARRIKKNNAQMTAS